MLFQFEGQEISLDLRVGIFITMNPGYAGRTELPESVKALFRPVVVIVPDLQQICEIMLFSEGFLTAKVLAKKMTVLYKLAREQLSKQYHYDFGLRALKSVLVMAGDLKRGSPDLPEVNKMFYISQGKKLQCCYLIFPMVNSKEFKQKKIIKKIENTEMFLIKNINLCVCRMLC